GPRPGPDPREPYRVVGEPEPDPLVVADFVENPVQSHVPAGQVPEAGPPDHDPEPPPAVPRPHDELAEEPERLAVADARQAPDRLAGELPDEEPVRVGGEERRAVVGAGVPPLGVGPVPDQPDLAGRHPPDGERGGVRWDSHFV